MADADVDIYGDLCDERPKNLLALPPVPVAADALALAVVPVMSPPPGSPPRQAPEAARPQIEDIKSAAGLAQERAPAPAWQEWDYTQGVPGDGGAEGAQEGEKPRDFDALQKELLADEKPAAADGEAGKGAGGDAGAREEGVGGSDTEPDDMSEVSGDVDDATIQLDEIRASERQPLGATPHRRWSARAAAGTAAPAGPGGGGTPASGSRMRRKEVSLFVGPPPPSTKTGGPAECHVLIGGLPWWLSDAELRRHAEKFGHVRLIRVLDYPATGKSTGIALLEYSSAEAAQRAAGTSEGLCSLAAWQTMSEAKPRIVLVSHELFARLRSGSPPWPEGGPCAEELRAIMMRQFDLSHTAIVVRNADNSPSRRRRRDASSGNGFGGNGFGRGPSPDADRIRRDEGWADKLRKLQVNVNRRLVDPIADRR